MLELTMQDVQTLTNLILLITNNQMKEVQPI